MNSQADLHVERHQEAYKVKHEMDISHLLAVLNNGDQDAFDALVPLVYEELHRLAHLRLRKERPDHTLNTTALVHEAYLRLVDVNQVQWQGRAHFLAMASRVMRRVLVDYANKRKTLKRGGDRQKVSLDEEVLLIPTSYIEAVMDLDEALTQLENVHPRLSQAIEYRYFGGLTLQETAEVLGVSLATVKRDLRFAQAWLAEAMSRDEE